MQTVKIIIAGAIIAGGITSFFQMASQESAENLIGAVIVLIIIIWLAVKLINYALSENRFRNESKWIKSFGGLFMVLAGIGNLMRFLLSPSPDDIVDSPQNSGTILLMAISFMSIGMYLIISAINNISNEKDQL